MTITEKQVIEVCKQINEEFENFKFLARGNHNESYYLKTKNKELVLRIENNNQFKNLKKEYFFLKKINDKFAPKVYFFDNSHKIINKDYLIEDFIKGEQPERNVDDNFVNLMAIWYKKLHLNKKLISLKDKKDKNFLNQFNMYDKNIKKYEKEVSIKIWQEYLLIMKEVKDLFEMNNHLLDRRKYFSIVQGDPTRGNVFYDKQSVKLIDWEFVDYDYPETDLVFFFYSYNLSKK